MIGALIGICPVPAQLSEIESILRSVVQTTSTSDDWYFGISIGIDQETSQQQQEVLLCSLVLPVDEDASMIVDRIKEQVPDTLEVDLWATAPAPLPLPPMSTTPDGQSHFVVRHFSASQEGTNDDEEWVSTMRQWGVVAQYGILKSKESVATLLKMVLRAVESTEQKIAEYRPHLKLGEDVILFKEIGSRGGQRFDLRLFQQEIVSFVVQFILPQVRNRLRFLIGVESDDELDFDVSVVYSKPGATYQGWHADGDHRKNHLDAGWENDGWKTRMTDPYAVCMFLPLIDLTEETGFTQFWPGSHRSRSLAGFGRLAEIASLTFDGILNAGDAVFYDYRLWHRGMPNNSDKLRPVLQIIFKKTWYVEKANYGTESLVPN